MGLKVENVSKHFGEKLAVDNISFDINNPGVFGLLGTNGAGKSTTIRMMLGILKKDSGEITWNGKKVERKNVNFGYLPEERGIYPKSKIYEQLLYFAELKGMKKENASKEIDYWMDKLKVSEYKNMTAEKLSKGNQQKVQFITSILNDPELNIESNYVRGKDHAWNEIKIDDDWYSFDFSYNTAHKVLRLHAGGLVAGSLHLYGALSVHRAGCDTLQGDILHLRGYFKLYT